jgi:chromate transporter
VNEGVNEEVGLLDIAREWARIGITGFGGPPVHIALLRRLCVHDRQWIAHRDFEDALSAANMLPGPASTQLAIYCAWRLRGSRGAVIGGLGFILPGLFIILILAALFLQAESPIWVSALAAGMGSAVPAIALNAAYLLVPGSLERARNCRTAGRWPVYAAIGTITCIAAGPYLVLALIGCGIVEIVRSPVVRSRLDAVGVVPAALATTVIPGGIASVCWVALKVGALSYGGGFVIVPLMQRDAVSTYHWMTSTQFLNAVALGQVTPGPVVQTVAVVGYAAGGLGTALLAALIAFAPSFGFVLGGGRHFDRLRRSNTVQAFLSGAGPAAIGGIAGSAVTLLLALHQSWQFVLFVLACGWLLTRREVVPAILLSGLVGIGAALAGLSIPH